MSRSTLTLRRPAPRHLTTSRRLPGETPSAGAARAEAEAVLRDLAFVFHLTRTVKEALTLPRAL